MILLRRRCCETFLLYRTRIGHAGPRFEAKFVSVYPSEEHGLCKIVTALNRDLGK